MQGHEMAAAWLIVGAIFFLIGELKSIAKTKGAMQISMLGITVMIFSVIAGMA